MSMVLLAVKIVLAVAGPLMVGFALFLMGSSGMLDKNSAEECIFWAGIRVTATIGLGWLVAVILMFEDAAIVDRLLPFWWVSLPNIALFAKGMEYTGRPQQGRTQGAGPGAQT